MTSNCATQSTDPQNPKQPGWKIQKSCTTSLLWVTMGSTLHRNRSEKRRFPKNPKLGVPSQRGGGGWLRSQWWFWAFPGGRILGHHHKISGHQRSKGPHQLKLLPIDPPLRWLGYSQGVYFKWSTQYLYQDLYFEWFSWYFFTAFSCSSRALLFKKQFDVEKTIS